MSPWRAKRARVRIQSAPRVIGLRRLRHERPLGTSPRFRSPGRLRAPFSPCRTSLRSRRVWARAEEATRRADARDGGAIRCRRGRRRAADAQRSLPRRLRRVSFQPHAPRRRRRVLTHRQLPAGRARERRRHGHDRGHPRPGGHAAQHGQRRQRGGEASSGCCLLRHESSPPTFSPNTLIQPHLASPSTAVLGSNTQADFSPTR